MTKKFKVRSTELGGLFLIENNKFIDDRGSLTKTFSEELFAEVGIGKRFKESYYSISKKNVLRGMHYQKHPFGHGKLVHVIEGEILDVIVGLGGTENPANRGKTFSTILSSENNRSLYVPDGYAHGFLVTSDKAVVVSYMTECYNEQHDAGVHYNSFGFEWPTTNPIVSLKDQNQILMTQLVY